MDIAAIIDELHNYCLENKKGKKNLFKTIQKEFLNGYIGSNINECLEDEKYEVYLYVKNKEKIACPLLLKKFTDVLEATNYFNEIVDLIEKNNPEYVINRCKIGL